jgi:hypothetical protein
MSFGLDDGVRFVVDFSIGGSGKTDLHDIAGGFKGVEEGVGKASESMSSFGEHGLIATEQLERMGEAGMGLVEVGLKVFEGWGKVFEVLLEKGSEFEQMLMRIRATNKTSAEAYSMAEGAVKIAGQLPITETMATRIMQTMATAHVDGLAKIGESYEALEKKGKTFKELPSEVGKRWDEFKKTGPSAVSVFADTLAAAGQLGGAQAPMAVHELAELVETGRLGSRLRFGALTQELVKVGHGAHDAAGRLKLMMEMLEHRGALGAAQASMNTLEAQLTNIRGAVDMIVFKVMEPGKKGGLMSEWVAGIRDLSDTFRSFFDESTPEGKKFLDMLKEVVRTISGPTLEAAHALAGVMDKLFTFMGDHPGMMQFVAVLSLVAAGMAVVSGVALVAAAAVGSLIAVLVFTPEVLLVIPGAIFLIVAAVAALTAAIGVGALAYEVWTNNLGGVRDFFEKIEIVIHAVEEAIKNWGGATTRISRETYEELKSHGLLSLFLEITHDIRVLQVEWENFTKGFEASWQATSVTFGETWTILEDIFSKVGEAIKSVMEAAFGAMGEGQNDIDAAATTGEKWGHAAGQVLQAIATFAKHVSQYVDESMGSVGDLIDGFSNLYRGVGIAWVVVKEMFHGLKIMLDAVLTAAFAVAEALGYISGNGNGFKHTKEFASGVAEGVSDIGADIDQGQRVNDQADLLAAAAKRVRATATGKRGVEQQDETGSQQDAWFAQQSGRATTRQPIQFVSHTYLSVDGKDMAHVVTKHQRQDIEVGGGHPDHRA